MKIIHFFAENVKRLKVVDITPKGAVVEIAGENGHGKTSVLDSIKLALGGLTKDAPSKPIRVGEDKARIELALGTGEKIALIVERSFTDKASYLTVRTEDGAKYPKPQALLDDLLGALTFDPLAFMRSDGAKQYEILRGLVKLDADLDALAAESKEAFEGRRDINRRITAKKASLAERDPVMPTTRIDTNEIVTRLSKVDEFNSEVREARRTVEQAEARLRAAQDQTAAARLALKKAQLAERAAVDELATVKSHEIPDLIDPAAIKQDLDLATETNARAEAFEKQETLKAEISDLEAEAAELTSLMEAIAARRRAAVEKADMPVKELSFGDGEVLFNGLPIDQASDAEQLKISTAIAAALNPKLRVIRIRDGSLLDDKAMEWLAAFAQDADMQIWIERVGEGGQGAIVLEDGAVRGAETDEA